MKKKLPKMPKEKKEEKYTLHFDRTYLLSATDKVRYHFESRNPFCLHLIIKDAFFNFMKFFSSSLY